MITGARRCALLLLLCAPLVPHRASAQVPVHEIETIPPTIRRMIVSAARYYSTAVLWRNEMVSKTRMAMQRAAALTSEREALERRAMGNLATFGGSLPRYNELRRRCAVDSTTASVCQAADVAMGSGIERIISTTYLQWRDTMFVAIDKARDETLTPLLGDAKLRTPGAANSLMFGTGGLISHFNQGSRQSHNATAAMGGAIAASQSMVQQTTASAIADSLDKVVQGFQDSVVTDTTQVSEARALQVELRARLAELWAQVNATRAEVLSLEATARDLQRQARDARLAPGLNRMIGPTP